MPCVSMCLCACVYVCVPMCVRVCVCGPMCAYLYVCACVYVRVCAQLPAVATSASASAEVFFQSKTELVVTLQLVNLQGQTAAHLHLGCKWTPAVALSILSH